MIHRQALITVLNSHTTNTDSSRFFPYLALTRTVHFFDCSLVHNHDDSTVFKTNNYRVSSARLGIWPQSPGFQPTVELSFIVPPLPFFVHPGGTHVDFGLILWRKRVGRKNEK